MKNYLFLQKVKWRNLIKKIKIRKILKIVLGIVLKRILKVIPKNLKVKNPIPEKEETISLNQKLISLLFF